MAAAVQITSASPPPDKELTKEVCASLFQFVLNELTRPCSC